MTHLIRDWMTPYPITINGANTLSAAYNLMRINHVRHLPVLNDDETLIGMLTWGDVREARPKASGSKEQNAGWEDHFLAAIRDVSEFMTPTPQTATASMPIAEAARLMIERKISCLPIIDAEELVGIVTEVDLFRFIMQTQAVDNSTEEEIPSSARENRQEHNDLSTGKPDTSNPSATKVYSWTHEPRFEATHA